MKDNFNANVRNVSEAVAIPHRLRTFQMKHSRSKMYKTKMMLTRALKPKQILM